MIPFVTSITTRANPLSVEEIYAHLLTHEMRLEQNQYYVALSASSAHIAAKGRPFQDGRGPRHFKPNTGRGILPSPQYSRGFSSSHSQSHRGRGRGKSFFTPDSHSHLHNVLHIPHITKNLLYVHQFIKSADTYFEFHPFHFFVKERASGKILLHGLSSHCLYSLPTLPASNKSSSASALMGERTTISDWHSIVGHPTLCIVRQLLSSF